MGKSTFVVRILDPFGDHLLSFGHGPLQIRRHNALCDTIYHALLTENNLVKREQQCFRFDAYRSGDIYHLDCLEGMQAWVF